MRDFCLYFSFPSFLFRIHIWCSEVGLAILQPRRWKLHAKQSGIGGGKGAIPSVICLSIYTSPGRCTFGLLVGRKKQTLFGLSHCHWVSAFGGQIIIDRALKERIQESREERGGPFIWGTEMEMYVAYLGSKDRTVWWVICFGWKMFGEKMGKTSQVSKFK